MKSGPNMRHRDFMASDTLGLPAEKDSVKQLQTDI